MLAPDSFDSGIGSADYVAGTDGLAAERDSQRVKDPGWGVPAAGSAIE